MSLRQSYSRDLSTASIFIKKSIRPSHRKASQRKIPGLEAVAAAVISSRPEPAWRSDDDDDDSDLLMPTTTAPTASSSSASPQRTIRNELKERSNLLNRVNSIPRRDRADTAFTFESLIVPPVRSTPGRTESWESGEFWLNTATAEHDALRVVKQHEQQQSQRQPRRSSFLSGGGSSHDETSEGCQPRRSLGGRGLEQPSDPSPQGQILRQAPSNLAWDVMNPQGSSSSSYHRASDSRHSKTKSGPVSRENSYESTQSRVSWADTHETSAVTEEEEEAFEQENHVVDDNEKCDDDENSSVSSKSSQGSYDPYRAGQDHDGDSSNDCSDEDESLAQGVVKRSTERCYTNDLSAMVMRNNINKDHEGQQPKQQRRRTGVQALKFLEENNWLGGQVMMTDAATSTSNSMVSRSVQSEGTATTTGTPTSKNKNSKSTIKGDSSVCTTALSLDDYKFENHLDPRRQAPARTRTGVLKDMFRRNISETNLDWTAEPVVEEEDGAEEEEKERRVSVQSSEKTKKEETIAAASVVFEQSPNGKRQRSSYCRARGRRAVDAWRRGNRASIRKQKKEDEKRIAFGLEFDPFAIEQVQFQSNIFRKETSKQQEASTSLFSNMDNAPKEPSTPVFSNMDKNAPISIKKSDSGELLGDNDAWQQDMEKLLAVSPEQHRKNRIKRGSF